MPRSPGANARFWKPDLDGRQTPFGDFWLTFHSRRIPVLSPAVTKFPCHSQHIGINPGDRNFDVGMLYRTWIEKW